MREERIREEKGMGHWECRNGEGDCYTFSSLHLNSPTATDNMNGRSVGAEVVVKGTP